MVTSLNVSQGSDGVSHISYTIKFEGTRHTAYGDFEATTEEAATAFKNAGDGDMWKGFRELVLQRLIDESSDALKGGTINAAG